MQLTSKKWLLAFAVCIAALLFFVTRVTVIADPFFHYHAPYTDRFYYTLDNERSQNDGIMRHFSYDGLITGTSMTQNFKASEAEALFGGTFVKLPYAGASYRELNEGIETAIRYNPAVKTVIRSVDQTDFFTPKDVMRIDMGDYPEYLYNDFLFDDVQYVWNREILFWRSYQMFRRARAGNAPGIDSFDVYSRWQEMYEGKFGAPYALAGRTTFEEPEETVPFTEEDEQALRENLEQNVISICRAHPDVTFYYFFPPYSVAWWGQMREMGELERRLKAEEAALNMLLEAGDNVHVYSFNNFAEITTNLNNYMDSMHYGDWVNSVILYHMRQGTGRITEETVEDYLEEIRRLYTEYDYLSLFAS